MATSSMGDVTLEEGREAWSGSWGDSPTRGTLTFYIVGWQARQVEVTFGHTGQADGKVGTRPLVKERQSYPMGMGPGQ